MKIQEKVEIIKTKYIQPSELGMILLIVLSSFLVGAIPIVIGMNTVKTENIVIPGEVVEQNSR